jgi:hypothetical protein
MAQRRTIEVTEEMVSLFARGLEMQAESHDDHSGEHDEYCALDKRLCCTLLQLPAHMVSSLHPMLDGPMPGYMARLASGRDWELSVQWRRALQAALDARSNVRRTPPST